MLVRRSVRWVAVLLLFLASPLPSVGASSKQPTLTPDQWNVALRELRLDPDSVTNPLAHTPEIAEATRRAIAGVVTDLEKLKRIQDYLFDPENAFTYDFVGTLTASQAFEDRKGNCVAFTNLFIAMSRAAGIPVQAALVAPRRGVEETDGDLSLVKNHIVAVYRHSAGSTVFDFYNSRTGAPIAIRPIDDLWTAALYVNNLGVNALRDDDLDLALVRFNIALRLASTYAPVYGNIGVVRRRMGDTFGAFDYYLLALLIEPGSSATRKNLHQVLEEYAEHAAAAVGETEAGEASLESRIFMARAATKLVANEVRKAKSLYRRANARSPEWVEPIMALARCELLLGRRSAAEKRIEEALALDPGNLSGRRLSAAIERVFEKQGRRSRHGNDTDVIHPEPASKPDRRGSGSGHPV